MNERGKEFYPDYLSEILIAIFFALGLVFVLAMLFPPSIGRVINFTAAFQPRPDWYFLWLYQIVRYFPGKWAFVGAVLIPLLSIALLFYIPFIDRSTAGSRKVAILCFAFLLGLFLISTLIFLLKQ